MVQRTLSTLPQKNPLRSAQMFEQAQQLFPGGVNSPVRAFGAVGGSPRFIDHGEGAFVVDVDGNRYIDYVLSYGPLILGHAHPSVVKAITEAAARGTSFGAPTGLAIELAELIQRAMPSLEMMRFVNSGTEATMSVLRLARAFTGRSKIIKFEGCYHGHADYLLVRAGSGVATLGLPDSPGVPAGTTADTIVATFNDLDSVGRAFEEHASQIAAIIVEPVAGNMGVVPPEDGFLSGLRSMCDAAGSLLVFDEVMTGFRVHPGGAQTLYGIRPDLTTLGKVIGGGLPVGAYGVRQEIMAMVAPSGPVYQAGTLSGNPITMAAGASMLRELQNPRVWSDLEATAARLQDGLENAAHKAGTPISYQRVGTMSSMFFSDKPIVNWETARHCRSDAYALFFGRMLEGGVYLAPSQFEAMFLSTAHDHRVIELTVAAVERALGAD